MRALTNPQSLAFSTGKLYDKFNDFKLTKVELVNQRSEAALIL